ncbi:MAG: ABC transporter permease [Methanomassiliicoccaceae archaeon]|jgi:ABC-2 type transport system permease protein|nr:ABC transporter permease [Methanomassiliicoccaceae archaeon]
MTFVSDRMRVIKASCVLSVHDTFTVIRPAVWVFLMVVPSLFSMFFFYMIAGYATGDPDYQDFVVIGNAVQAIGMTTIYSVASIPGDQKHIGTMGSIYMSPSGLFSIFLGMSLFSILAGFISVAVSLVFAAFVFGVSMASMNVISVAVVILLTAISVGGISMIIGSVGLYLRTSAILANVFTYLGLILCGVNFPVTDLPGWAQKIAHCHPLTHAVEATRGAVGGSTVTDLADPILMMILLGIIFAVGSVLTFRFFEKLSRKKGRLDVF